MGIYESSRQRKHSDNVSASSSLAWACRSLGHGSMASTNGIPKPTAQLRIADCVVAHTNRNQ
jgi:hypothetical protein